VTGEQRIAFILYNFQDNMSEPVSVAQAEELMEQVNEYYQEISYGKTWRILVFLDILHCRQVILHVFMFLGKIEFLKIGVLVRCLIRIIFPIRRV
jgi:hypothetical protein